MPDPISIALVTTTRGAAWTTTCLLAGALPLERFRVTVAAIGSPPDVEARADLMHLAPHASLTVLDGPCDTDRDPWTTLEGARSRLALLCERVKPRVLHANHMLVGALPVEVPRVVTAASELVTRAAGKSGDPELARLRAEVKATLAKAEVVVAPSAHLAREIERAYKLKDGVRVIRTGVPSVARNVLDRGLAALAIGPLDDTGRHMDWLVAIAARLPGPVGVLGTTARSLPRNVVALGRLSHKDRLALLGGTKVFLGLARADHYGLEAAEANAAGARLVLADNATNRELWGSVAELARDPDSLALALSRAHAAPKLPKPATPRYAIAQTASAYARIFEEVARA